MRRFYFLLGFIFILSKTFSQTVVSGIVKDVNGNPVEGVTVIIKELGLAVSSNNTGNFKIEQIKTKAESLTLICKLIGYKDLIVKIDFPFSTYLQLRLNEDTKELSEVVISNKLEKREEASLIILDPKSVRYLPSAFGDFNKILTTLPGVSSNSELSSTYSVRGGSFDENLVYVNDIEIYRPLLVSQGQQEGLSFVNPNLVNTIEFSSGGWQAKYGDKLASVLNIQYKSPNKFGGSATGGFLGGNFHVEGATKNKRVSYIIGARHKNSRYLLVSQPTKGQYLPRFYDIQTFIDIDLTSRKNDGKKGKTYLGILSSFALNRYEVIPTTSQTTFGTLERTLNVKVAFDGLEKMNYDTYQGGIKLTHWMSKKYKTLWMASKVHSKEREYSNLEAGYRLCEVNIDPNGGGINECANDLGIGTLFNYSRNRLDVNVLSLETKHSWLVSEKINVEAGFKYAHESISDKLSEYHFVDSSDYISVNESRFNNSQISSHRNAGFIQFSYQIDSIQKLTIGARVSHWDVNNQLLFSPRLQYSISPKWKRDIIFKAATGVYQQAPFYRELRDKNGIVNRNVKAQTSYHLIGGLDYKFKSGKKEYTLTTEAYYKYIQNVNAYDVDNVRIRYFANNNAVAYATGIDVRIAGEFIKGEQSWFSMGILSTKENLFFDNQENVRRPTDQRINFAVFLQDHLPKYPSIKMYLNLIYGTGLPTGPPNDLENRTQFKIPAYRRVDIGFSKLISLNDPGSKKSKYFNSLWMGIEVLNLLGVNNTLSYLWIKDVNNVSYAIPQTLTQRFVNARVEIRF